MFAYFLCFQAPSKRCVVRRRNLARRRVTTTSTTTSVGFCAYWVVVTKKIEIFKQLEIRSMERGICPIAVFYFALKRAFFKTLLVNKDNQWYQILGHMTSLVTLP